LGDCIIDAWCLTAQRLSFCLQVGSGWNGVLSQDSAQLLFQTLALTLGAQAIRFNDVIVQVSNEDLSHKEL
jgi:hypothetical protein